jgi:hypothetical protein
MPPALLPPSVSQPRSIAAIVKKDRRLVIQIGPAPASARVPALARRIARHLPVRLKQRLRRTRLYRQTFPR